MWDRLVADEQEREEDSEEPGDMESTAPGMDWGS